METLRATPRLSARDGKAMACKDIRAFGELIDLAWNLNKHIDPDSTTDVIEGILERIKPHIHGAKLLGAGGEGSSSSSAGRARTPWPRERPSNRNPPTTGPGSSTSRRAPKA